VDLIFSTATFHWIKDHDRLFRRLAQALKPQGRLVAQCGGKGNTARTQNAMEQGMGEGRFPTFFTGLEDP
jgi:trans-aconitate 2-methyltransferase